MDSIYPTIRGLLPNILRSGIRRTAKLVGANQYLPARGTDRLTRQLVAVLSLPPKIATLKEIQELVREGANVNENLGAAGSPLHLAIEFQNIDVVHFLIANGASLTAVNEKGQTPFQFALTILKLKSASIVFLLREASNVVEEIPSPMKRYYTNYFFNNINSLHTIILQMNSNRPYKSITAAEVGATNPLAEEDLSRYISRPCLGQLELLHQHTGQCWNDSSIVFLWFASGAGNQIQKALQIPNIDTLFFNWMTSEDVMMEIKELFPGSLGPWEGVVEFLSTYIYCMKERYNLWLSTPRKPIGIAARTSSQCLSLCGEESGIIAADLLSASGFQERGLYARESNRNRTITRFQEGLSRGTLPESIITQRGFHYEHFAGVLFLLLHFFLLGNIKLCNLTLRDIESNYVYLNAILERATQPLLIGNVYDTHYFNNETAYSADWRNYRSIFEHMRRTGSHVSILAKCIQPYVGEIERAHAVLFLTCEDGSQYYYDNNDYILYPINWSLLFDDFDDDFITLVIPDIHELQIASNNSFKLLGKVITQESGPLFFKLRKQTTTGRYFLDLLYADGTHTHEDITSNLYKETYYTQYILPFRKLAKIIKIAIKMDYAGFEEHFWNINPSFFLIKPSVIEPIEREPLTLYYKDAIEITEIFYMAAMVRRNVNPFPTRQTGRGGKHIVKRKTRKQKRKL